jgi:hypothetical protein
MKLQRAMVGVAMVAVVLGLVKAFERALAPPTPAEWARRKAATYEESALWRESKDARENHLADARQFRELAETFERLSTPWEEATYLGPFTDKLPSGTLVRTRHSLIATSPQHGTVTADVGERWAIREGTACVVVSDRVIDDDDCYAFRTIEVRMLEGPYKGKLTSVKRIHLYKYKMKNGDIAR